MSINHYDSAVLEYRGVHGKCPDVYEVCFSCSTKKAAGLLPWAMRVAAFRGRAGRFEKLAGIAEFLVLGYGFTVQQCRQSVHIRWNMGGLAVIAGSGSDCGISGKASLALAVGRISIIMMAGLPRAGVLQPDVAG